MSIIRGLGKMKFKCDCQSCNVKFEIAHGEFETQQSVESEMRQRGWRVDPNEKTYCPTHAFFMDKHKISMDKYTLNDDKLCNGIDTEELNIKINFSVPLAWKRINGAIIFVNRDFHSISVVHTKNGNGYTPYTAVLASSNKPINHAICLLTPVDSAIKIVDDWSFKDVFTEPPRDAIHYIYQNADGMVSFIDHKTFNQICGGEVAAYSMSKLLQLQGF